jgi:hypothetical protein
MQYDDFHPRTVLFISTVRGGALARNEKKEYANGK